jgi:uncharacterized protein YjeT (DUF2065 family)
MRKVGPRRIDRRRRSPSEREEEVVVAHVLAPLTLKLAEAIGLYLIAAGIGLTLSPARWRGLIDEIEGSPGLAIVMGAVAFWIGAGLLLAHRDTSSPLALIVTAFGVIAAFKGVLILACPAMLKLYRPLMGNPRLWGIVALVAGILLFLAGLTGRADYIPTGVI